MALRANMRQGFPVTVDEIKTLPVAQKLQIMEAIWEDFRAQFEKFDAPGQLKELLDRRRARVHDGSAQLLDWAPLVWHLAVRA